MSSRPGARPSSGTILIGLVAVVVAVLVAIWVVLNGQAIVRSFFPPDPATTQGRAIHDLYTIVFIIAVAIFFVVEGLIVWTVIRYRRKPGDDELPPQTHGHNLAEVVWTVVPTLIVIFLFFISWQTLNTVEAKSNAPDLLVRAHAGQFQWTFDYMAPGAKATDDPVFSVSTPFAPDGGLVPAGRQDDPLLPDEQRRHPRVLRPAVPVQARRRPGPRQRVRPVGRGELGRPGVSAASAPSCAASATTSCCSTSASSRRPSSRRGTTRRSPRPSVAPAAAQR